MTASTGHCWLRRLISALSAFEMSRYRISKSELLRIQAKLAERNAR